MAPAYKRRRSCPPIPPEGKGRPHEADRLVSSETRQRVVERVRRRIADCEHVIAGPWTGEVGYELLYWIPLLRWLTRQIPDLAERLVAVSRGGVESWYADMTSRYVEVFDLMAPAEIAAERRRENPWITKPSHRKLQPLGVKKDTELDALLVTRAAEALGLEDYAVVPSSLAYKAARDSRSEGGLAGAFLPEVISPPEPAAGIDLPPEYIVCRFYSGGGTPDHPGVRSTVEAIVSAISEHLPVVSLDPGLRLDEHRDYPVDAIALPELEPRSNLRAITSVVARSSFYIGSYGGLSYLGPYLGIPTVTWLAQPASGPGAGEPHLQMIRTLFASPRFGDYVVIGPGLERFARLLGATADAIASRERLDQSGV